MNASRNDQVPVQQLVLLRRVRDRIDREFDHRFKRSMAQIRRRRSRTQSGSRTPQPGVQFAL
ncbi:MAG TPA: hypothetical protein DEW39_11580 [Brevibacterium sp.]|nr:hypothetical protein [Brevibacterium sp.]